MRVFFFPREHVPEYGGDEITAFDGPGPFDGDAVYNYLDQAELPPLAFREAVAGAFSDVIAGGAARHTPPEIFALLGLEKPDFGKIVIYVDVDDATWAWACAELVALAMGHQPETPVPDVFARAARTLPEPEGLIPDALKALQIVSDPKRSELAGLLEHDQAPLQRMERLRLMLKGA